MPDHIIYPDSPSADADRAEIRERFPEDAPQAPAAAPTPAPAPAPAPVTPPAPVAGQQYYPEDILGELDKLIAARGEAQVTVSGGRRMSYNTDSDALIVDGVQVDHSTLTGGEFAGADSGIDLEAMQAQALAVYNKLADAFDEIDGYDKEGKPLYKIADPEARENMARRLATMHSSLTYQAHRYHALQQQRERAEAEQARKQRETYAISAWAGGDPRKMEMLKEEIAREEARTVAAGIVKSRAGLL